MLCVDDDCCYCLSREVHCIRVFDLFQLMAKMRGERGELGSISVYKYVNEYTYIHIHTSLCFYMEDVNNWFFYAYLYWRVSVGLGVTGHE